MPRKKPQSVSVDGRYWVGGEAERAPAVQPDTWGMLAEAVLPSPSVTGQRARLAAEVLADYTCLLVNFVAVSQLRLALDFAIHHAPSMFPQQFLPGPAMGLLLLQGILLTLLGYTERLYQTSLNRSVEEHQVAVGKVVAWSTLMVATATRLVGIHVISTWVVLASAPMNYGAMLGWRQWQRRSAARDTRNGCPTRNVLIVGAGRIAEEVAACLARESTLGRVVRGFLVAEGPIGGDILGTVDDLAKVARAEFVDEIILAIPGQPDMARRVIQEAQKNRLDVKVVPDLLGFELQSATLERFGRVPVLTLHQEPIPALGLFLKRTIDVIGSAAALLTLSPLMTLIALLIKADSRGPILYRAQRVGQKGRKFICHKFRTMGTDADQRKDELRNRNQRQGAFFKIADDPRVTRLGHFLRRYSLDELPQLWNVLKGDMSLVGPRPHPLDDFAHYDLNDLRRLDVTPGITGLWQVTARRDPSFERNMALDLEYIERWDLWMDLRILYRTVAAVLRGTGA
jgi:exopolysaccharide biosynthesis polyprenyl glycosylphosphotransferase